MQIIVSGTLAREHQAMFVIALLRLSLKSALYPSCLILKDVEREPFPCASGTFGDVYKGSVQGSAVCIKMVRVYKKTEIDHALQVLPHVATKFLIDDYLCRHFPEKQCCGVRPNTETSFPSMESINWMKYTGGYA
jgi:hypothetical protein